MYILLCQMVETKAEVVDLMSGEYFEQLAFIVRLEENASDAELAAIYQMTHNPKIKPPEVSIDDEGKVVYRFNLRNSVRIEHNDQLYKILQPYFADLDCNITAVVHSRNKGTNVEFYLVNAGDVTILDKNNPILPAN